jgi:hypothetical protein
MRRLRKLAVIPFAAAALAAFTVLVPASAPALANGPREYLLIVNSGNTSAGILYRGHNQQLQLNYGTASLIYFVNPHTWHPPGYPAGQTVTVWEIQVAGVTNECFNYVSSLDGFAADSCISSDTNEWFWQNPTGSSTNGARNFWYINASASAHYNPPQNIYVTAAGYYQGANIYADQAGFGGLAAWNRPCRVNC